MTVWTTITFGSLTIYIIEMNLTKNPGTTKQKIGGKIRAQEMPDKPATQREWSGTMRGVLFDTNRDADRTTLQGYLDDLEVHGLADGVHDGNYYVVGLEWDDDAEEPNAYFFNITIIEEK